MMAAINVCVVLALRMMDFSPGLCSLILSHYIHPDSQISAELDSVIFDEAAACWSAVFQLGSKGIEEIQICEVMRIEAPLSGYLVDATGYLEADDSTAYNVFRIGILSGEENGGEFVFLAGGLTEQGESILLPPMEYQEDSISVFVCEHEFLFDADAFLTLQDRFPASSI